MSGYELKEGTRVLLTGATGFIGRRLTQALLEQGCDVIALVLPDEVDAGGVCRCLPQGVRVVVGDVTNGSPLADGGPGASSAILRVLEAAQPTFVFHLAAVGTADTGLPMAEACRVNVGGMIALLEAIRRTETVQRVVVIGTSYEYGARRADDGLDPFNPYSASKVAAWAFARAAYNAWGLPVVSVRPFQVYGPGQRREALVPAAIAAVLQGQDFHMTQGEQQRDFVYVDDVVRGLLAAMQAPDMEGRVVDVGSGKLHRIIDVVERVWELASTDRRTGSAGRIVAGALSYRPGEVFAIPADVARTYQLTGWRAHVSLDEGLRMTIRSYQMSRDPDLSGRRERGEQSDEDGMKSIEMAPRVRERDASAD